MNEKAKEVEVRGPLKLDGKPKLDGSVQVAKQRPREHSASN
jgi:hypothetical protein